MRKSGLSKAKQDRLIEYFVVGATARWAASLVGLNRNTSAYYFHRLREIIAREVVSDSIVCSDCWRGCNVLDVSDFKHCLNRGGAGKDVAHSK